MSEFTMEPPANSVICIVDSKQEFDQLKEALATAGYTDIEYLHGQKGYEELDPKGTRSGVGTRIMRAFQRFTTGVDERTLDRMGQALKDDKYVVAAITEGTEEEKEEVGKIMSDNNGTAIFFSGATTIELMEGW